MKQQIGSDGPVGEQGFAWYDDFTIEELLERIIGDAYALGSKVGYMPYNRSSSKLEENDYSIIDNSQ